MQNVSRKCTNDFAEKQTHFTYKTTLIGTSTKSQQFTTLFTCFGQDLDHHSMETHMFTLLLSITVVNLYLVMRVFVWKLDEADEEGNDR